MSLRSSEKRCMLALHFNMKNISPFRASKTALYQRCSVRVCSLRAAMLTVLRASKHAVSACLALLPVVAHSSPAMTAISRREKGEMENREGSKSHSMKSKENSLATEKPPICAQTLAEI